MKAPSSWLGSVLACAFVVASAGGAPPAIDVVGPAHPERRLSLPPGSGTLRVYSDTYKIAAARGGSVASFPHTGFVLLSQDGRVLNHVENNNGTGAESPVPVVLAPGRYAARARSTHYGELLIPVEIAAGKATLVYLTSAGMPATAAAGADALVRLPNGHVVGVRAPAAAR